MRKVLVGLFIVLMVSGCAAPMAAAPTPTPAPTPEPTCAELAAPFVQQVDTLAGEWDDATKLANSTPRASLSAQIEKLQALRREAEALQAPECAAPAKQSLVSSMDTTVEAFIAFLGQKPENDVQILFLVANEHLANYKTGLRQLQAGKTVTIAPFLTDGLDVARSVIQEPYTQKGYVFKDSPLADGTLSTFALSDDQLSYVELIGPPDNIQQARLFRSLKGGGAAQLNEVKDDLRAFIGLAAPDWGDGGDWVITAVDKPDKQFIATRGRVVSFERATIGAEDTFTLAIVVP